TIAIEYRWAEGRGERFAEIAAEFVRLKVDVIVTVGGAVLAAKQATSLIPIVFAVGADPVGGGSVASLARPGGNRAGIARITTTGEVSTAHCALLDDAAGASGNGRAM